MNKIHFDYVMSGPSMFRLIPAKKYQEDKKYLSRRNSVLNDGIKFINELINTRYSTFTVDLSILYNGYTESKIGVDLLEMFKPSFVNFYADSGGLQVITAGAKLDDKTKNKIYSAQDIATYSFCFDEIPVEKKNEHDWSHRSSVANMLFVANKIEEKARKTARNVKEQLESLKQSKVLYIIQGNTIDDMLRWFDYGVEELGVENLHRLGGIALSCACMGNGELETIDSVVACKLILDKYPTIPRRLHLLGFGGYSRMLPALLFMKSGFLKDVTLSADSSSQSMAFIMGHYKAVNECKSSDINILRKHSYREFVNDMKPFFEKVIGHEIDVEDLVQFIFDNNRAIGNIEDVLFNDREHRYSKLSGGIAAMYGVWNTVPFLNNCDLSLRKTDKHYSQLMDVVDINEFYIWRSTHFSKLKSARISRKRKVVFK